MFKKILPLAIAVLIVVSNPLFAEDTALENTSTIQQKSFKKYLAFRTKILDARSDARALLKDFRDLARIERWSGDVTKKKMQGAESSLKLLANYNKNFTSYEDHEFEIDFANVETLSKNIAAERATVQNRLALHKKIKKEITNCLTLSDRAYNANHKLYAKQKDIEFFYKSRFANSAATPLGVIEARLKTGQVSEEIASIVSKINDIAKAELLAFASDDLYNPEELLQNLLSIKSELSTIEQKSLKDLKNSSTSLEAFKYVPAN